MTYLEAKVAARRLFPVPLLLEREFNQCVVRVAVEHEVRRAGGATVYEARAELGRGKSWLEAMRSAALTWTASMTVEHLRAKAELEDEQRNLSGRSSDQPGLISQASLGAAPGPATVPPGTLLMSPRQFEAVKQEAETNPVLFDSLDQAHRDALRASRGLPPEGNVPVHPTEDADGDG